VTGVQTCALPISLLGLANGRGALRGRPPLMLPRLLLCAAELVERDRPAALRHARAARARREEGPVQLRLAVGVKGFEPVCGRLRAAGVNPRVCVARAENGLWPDRERGACDHVGRDERAAARVVAVEAEA